MLEVYVKDGCPYCEKQLDIFKKKGLEYKLYNISVDREAHDRVRDLFKADKVPVVVEDGIVTNIGFGGGG